MMSVSTDKDVVQPFCYPLFSITRFLFYIYCTFSTILTFFLYAFLVLLFAVFLVFLAFSLLLFHIFCFSQVFIFIHSFTFILAV